MFNGALGKGLLDWGFGLDKHVAFLGCFIIAVWDATYFMAANEGFLDHLWKTGLEQILVLFVQK